MSNLKDVMYTHHPVDFTSAADSFPQPVTTQAVSAQLLLTAASLRPPTLTHLRRQMLKARLLEAATAKDFSTISDSDWRNAPWTFWYEDDTVARNLRIVLAFFDAAKRSPLPIAIKTLISVYFIEFPLESRTLKPISEALQRALESRRWPVLTVWQERHQAWKLFDIHLGPRQMAAYLLSADDISQGLSALGLLSLSERGESRFVTASLKAAIDLAHTQFKHEFASSLISSLMSWALLVTNKSLAEQFPSLRILLVDVLQHSRTELDPHIQPRITHFLRDHYGDTTVVSFSPIEPQTSKRVNPLGRLSVISV
jgi:hypothetical protein